MISEALEAHLQAIICAREGAPLVSVFVPMALPNPVNGSHGHWQQSAARRKAQRSAAYVALRQRLSCYPPCVVRLVRQSQRPLDSDNCAASLKSVRDGVADALGVDDRDPRVQWVVDQQRGREAGVLIEVYANRKG